MKRAILGGLFAAIAATAGGLAPASAAEAPTTTQTVAEVTLANTIAISGCSASYVRFPVSTDSDPAMMLTNGHCYEGGFLGAGQYLSNRASSISGSILDANGNSRGTVRASKVIYATMTDTDVALYQLTETFAQVNARTGSTPMTIAASHPADNIDMAIPSGYWKTVYNCHINGFTDLREGEWSWTDSIRYAEGCNTIHGTSGSPIVDPTSGDVIGINNTGSDNGEMCTVNNPCEVNPDGTTRAYLGRSYGQQTYILNNCVNGSRTFDLTLAGCTVPGGAGSGATTPTRGKGHTR